MVLKIHSNLKYLLFSEPHPIYINSVFKVFLLCLCGFLIPFPTGKDITTSSYQHILLVWFFFCVMANNKNTKKTINIKPQT